MGMRHLGNPNAASGWRGGSQGPGPRPARAVSQTSGAAAAPSSAPRGRGCGGGGGVGRGVAPVAPALSDAIGPPQRVRATFPRLSPPSRLRPSGGWSGRAADVSAKFAALGVPRVAAAAAREAAGSACEHRGRGGDRSCTARPCHTAHRWAREQLGAAGRAPRGADGSARAPGCRPGTGPRWDLAPEPGGRAQAGTGTKDAWAGKHCRPPLSGAPGAQQHGSRASAHRDRERDARSLSAVPRREAARGRSRDARLRRRRRLRDPVPATLGDLRRRALPDAQRLGESKTMVS